MTSFLAVIRKTKNAVFYSIPRFSLVTNKFLEDFDWPEGIKTAGFVSAEGHEGVTLGENIPDKYSPRWTYSKELEKSGSPAVGPDQGKSLAPGKLKDFEELRKLYLDTHLWFYNAWPGKFGPEYMKGIEVVVERFLPAARALYLEKDGKAAGLLTLVKWEDCHGAPVDWITWVWLREDLSPAEKLSARRYILDWLALNSTERVQCAIDAFNIRSQKFFLKLGFSPQCLYIAKPQ